MKHLFVIIILFTITFLFSGCKTETAKGIKKDWQNVRKSTGEKIEDIGESIKK